MLETAKNNANQGRGATGLGALSTHGDHPKNAMRDVRRAIGWPDGAPELKWIELGEEGGTLKPHPVLCPIETYEKLCEIEMIFKDKLLGPPGALAEYWQGLEGTVLYQPKEGVINHSETLAGGIHADGAPTNKVSGLFSI